MISLKLLAFVIFCFSVNSFGDPGFRPYNFNLPPLAARAENATVAIFTQTVNGFGPLGTGFLIDVKPHGKKFRGLFLTNEHVVKLFGSTGFGGTTQICHHVKFSDDPKLSKETALQHEGHDAWCSDVISVFKPDADHDVAAFVTEVPASYAAEDSRAPLSTEWNLHAGRDARVELIGMPNMRRRWGKPTSLDAKGKPVPESLHEMVWSQGTLFGEMQISVNKKPLWVLATDTDSLYCMSGGPLILENGTIIGINRSFAKDNNATQYGPNYREHAVPAEDILEYLKSVDFK